MTIDDAIMQQISAAEAFEKAALEGGVSELTREGRKMVATDHRQLAEWLTELRDRQWVSVEDRLPEEIGYYLVVIGNEMLISIDIAEYSEGYWHKHDKVLYWQPLPKPPKED